MAKLNINGTMHDVQAEADTPLLWVIREQVGLTDYRLVGNEIHLTHTEIDPKFRGGGLGAHMVQGVLDSIRTETDYRVVAACPFVVDWLERHPEYHELESRGL